MLIDSARPSASAEMIADLADHLRLPQGFGDDALSAATLARVLDVALRVVEDRSRRVLMQRRLLLRVGAWDADGTLRFPVGPVVLVQDVAIGTAEGEHTPVDPESWRLETRVEGSVLRARVGRRLPTPPRDGHIEASFVAGFGPLWRDAPNDLRHATVQLAGSYFEGRSETARSAGQLPAGVAALLEPYRRMRL